MEANNEVYFDSQTYPLIKLPGNLNQFVCGKYEKYYKLKVPVHDVVQFDYTTYVVIAVGGIILFFVGLEVESVIAILISIIIVGVQVINSLKQNKEVTQRNIRNKLKYNEDVKKYNTIKTVITNIEDKSDALREATIAEFKNQSNSKKSFFYRKEHVTHDNYLLIRGDLIYDDHKYGLTEKLFQQICIVVFGDSNVHVDQMIKDVQYNYVPDILLTFKNLTIDVEIDEPYTSKAGIPIHYTDEIEFKDRKEKYRDQIVTQCKFCVIRFAEEQICNHPVSSCLVITDLLMMSTGEARIPLKMNRLKVDRWNKSEALAMFSKQYRKSYAGNLLDGDYLGDSILGTFSENSIFVITQIVKKGKGEELTLLSQDFEHTIFKLLVHSEGINYVGKFSMFNISTFELQIIESIGSINIVNLIPKQ